MVRLRAGLLLLLVAGCGSAANSHSIAAKNYARTCVSIADCFAVYEGPVGCCTNGCPNTAIRQDAVTKYMSDLVKASMCTIRPPCAAPGGCEEGRVACQNGVCELETLRADAATDE